MIIDDSKVAELYKVLNNNGFSSSEKLNLIKRLIFTWEIERLNDSN